mmetsp:Transcript_20204/g.43653  ORF Transcript_20204/g.43653 Transcript_20204/m.43653 type:complete len:205 (+) Transcript_20204:134-748(+)
MTKMNSCFLGLVGKLRGLGLVFLGNVLVDAVHQEAQLRLSSLKVGVMEDERSGKTTAIRLDPSKVVEMKLFLEGCNTTLAKVARENLLFEGFRLVDLEGRPLVDKGNDIVLAFVFEFFQDAIQLLGELLALSFALEPTCNGSILVRLDDVTGLLGHSRLLRGDIGRVRVIASRFLLDRRLCDLTGLACNGENVGGLSRQGMSKS